MITQIEKIIAELNKEKAICKQVAIDAVAKENHLKAAIKEGECIVFSLCIKRLTGILNLNKPDVSNSLFEGAKPLTGEPLELLEKCMSENAKSKPTLKGRL